MRDTEAVACIVAGDADGLATAYDRYADPLFKYCRILLSDPAGAADAVADTFVIAAARVNGLREPEKPSAALATPGSGPVAAALSASPSLLPTAGSPSLLASASPASASPSPSVAPGSPSASGASSPSASPSVAPSAARGTLSVYGPGGRYGGTLVVMPGGCGRNDAFWI